MGQNTIFWIIIGIIVVDMIIERWLAWKNQLSLKDPIPLELEGLYDEEKYRKMMDYNAEKGRFSALTSVFSFVLIMLLLFLEGFAWLDVEVRAMSDNAIVQVLLYFAALAIASDILGMPFTLYNTFVIEEKYGFNRTTLKTFVLDKIKGYLLGALIGGGLTSLIVWIYLSTGAYFWLLAWGVVTFFTLFMTAFYSSLILPMFNKLTKLEDGELRNELTALCNKVGFKLNDLFIMDGSKRSSKANAFFSGLGSRKRIVLFDTLVEDHTTEELVGVLAHEIGHYKLKHTLVSTVLSILQTGLMLFVLSLLIDSPVLSAALGAEHPSFQIGIIAFGMLYSPLSTVIGLLMNKLSRTNEYAADAYARKVYKAEPLITALKKMSVEHLSNLTPDPTYVFFHYSHPPLLQRLRALSSSS